MDQFNSNSSKQYLIPINFNTNGLALLFIDLFYLLCELLIAAATGSHFNMEIQEARLPKRFKLQAIKAYEGKSDP